MLSQLADLSRQADGRYATKAELNFLKSWLEQKTLRQSAYEKVVKAEEMILDEVEEAMKQQNPQIFNQDGRDCTAICRRDRQYVLRYIMAAVLFNDLDRLREGFLIWQGGIVRCFSHHEAAGLTCKVLPKVLGEHLETDELNLILPAIRLAHTHYKN
ncbi:MAG: phycobilisome protein [Microcystaceae cyanobacterium]